MSVIVGVAAILAVMAGPVESQIKVPPDFTFEKGKDSPGPVTFSHEKHKAKIEKCTECHTKIFKMKKGTSGPFSMEKIKAGEQCGTCHNGKTQVGGTTVFAAGDEKNCEKCHKK
ncbi:MAG TPA: c(7)-type cytochrome triheme domain-containing protein [Methylomirabilota bacterium]|nr:c(7)-type cytochrome triheme domain-containing protein [Methylomirabilota bacterium]